MFGQVVVLVVAPRTVGLEVVIAAVAETDHGFRFSVLRTDGT